MKQRKYIAISTFSTSTRFGIDPSWIGVIESGSYTGCIEVHLDEADYNWTDRHGRPGGKGLVIAGHHNFISDWAKIDGCYAIIDGHLEVFQVQGHYDRVVLLRPLGIGLGYRWELMRRYEAMKSRKRRVQKKHASKASNLRAGVRHSVALLTGTLAALPRPKVNEGPYFLREQTDRASTSKVEVQLSVLTLSAARQLALARVEELRNDGWTCGQEGSCGTLERDTPSSNKWMCQKGGKSRWVSVEHGQAGQTEA